MAGLAIARAFDDTTTEVLLLEACGLDFDAAAQEALQGSVAAASTSPEMFRRRVLGGASAVGAVAASHLTLWTWNRWTGSLTVDGRSGGPTWRLTISGRWHSATRVTTRSTGMSRSALQRRRRSPAFRTATCWTASLSATARPRLHFGVEVFDQTASVSGGKSWTGANTGLI